jgi:adenosylcobinamide-GDP ribazoletransferase
MGFFAALSFLTLIPVPNRWKENLKSGPPYFPLVGALLGIIVWGIYEIVVILAGKATGATAAVVTMAFLTRGLHLDGLADTFDALGSGKTGKKALAVMKDPQIGPFGAVAVLSILLLKGALIYDLPPEAIWRPLMLFPIMGRMGVLLPLCFLPYAREKGIVTVFQPSGNRTFLGGLGLSLILALVLGGIGGLAALSSTLLFCYLFSVFLMKKVGGITGDTLGATVELAEVAALLSIHLWVA